MRNLIMKCKIGFLMMLACFLTVTLQGNAAELENRQYDIFIEDDANLLSSEEEQHLYKKMEEVAQYGYVMFKSIDENYMSTDDFAREYYHETFGSDSGIIFIIDMDNRQIYIFSDGYINTVVNSQNAYTITDNVYSDATDGDYLDCAYKAFDQVNTLLKGQNIPKPMKYTSNLLLALLVAFIINYLLVLNASRAKKASEKSILEMSYNRQAVRNPSAVYMRETRTYNPHTSSDSGSSGGGGGSSSSGSGGGHSF